jgi:V8-like Glu-specific endopeptidase
MTFNSSSFPYDTVVYVTDTLGGYQFQASGVLISPDEVLTAAHVIYDVDLGVASNITVSPAYNAGSAPFGSVKGISYHYFQVDDSNGVISESDTQHDFAVIHLSQPLNVGWMKMEADYAGGAVHVTGYPGYANGTMVDVPETVYLDQGYSVYVGTDTGAGSSGGPVWITQNGQTCVVGVVSSGDGWNGYFGQMTSTIVTQLEACVTQDDAALIYSAANAGLLYAYQQVTAPIAVADSSSAVVGALAALQSMAVAGDLKSITLTDGGTPTLTVTATQAGQDAAAFCYIAGSYSLTVTGTTAAIGAFLAKEDAAGRGLDGVAADYAGMAPAGGNSVVGFQNAAFASGYDAVLLNAPRSSYAVQVNAGGVATIKDIGAGDANFGQTVTVSGESYLIFDSAASVTDNGAPVYPQMLFVETWLESQIAALYQLSLNRQPDLAGLEYWFSKYAGYTASGLSSAQALSAVANGFLVSTEFNANFPAAAAAADHGGPHDQAFLAQLYTNVLGRQPDPAGFAYWTNLLASGADGRADVMTGFAASPEFQSALSASQGSWLVNAGLTGGYADSSLGEAAQAVVNQGAAAFYLNTGLIDPTTIPAGGTTAVGGITIAPQAGVATVGTSTASTPMTIVLSAGVPNAVIDTDSVTVIGAPAGGDRVTLSGSSATVDLHGQGNTVTFANEASTSGGSSLPAALGATVTGYQAGHDSLATQAITAAAGYGMSVQLLTPTVTAPLNGSSLSFAATVTVVDVGAVGDGSAAAVAAALNAVYHVAGTNGNDALSGGAGMGETLVVIGETSANNAVVYQFGSFSHTANHPNGIVLTTPDVNHNGVVDAAELQPIATLVGVQASTLTAADL